MKNVSLFALASLLLMISSCTLKQVIYPASTTTDGSTTSGSTLTGTYQPLTAGSTWVYNLTAAIGPSIPSTITITGDTKTINGKTYYKSVQVTSGSTQVGYFSHSGSVYTDRSDDPSPDDILDETYLDDSLPVNSTFTYKANDTGTSYGATVQYVGKIVEKGTSKTVNGKTYTNVIHTHVELQTGAAGSFQTTQVTEFYVAKGIGIIQLDGYVAGALIASQTLVSYNIK